MHPQATNIDLIIYNVDFINLKEKNLYIDKLHDKVESDKKNKHYFKYVDGPEVIKLDSGYKVYCIGYWHK